jgi:hypothetical protein
MTTSEIIRQAIASSSGGAVFSNSDFLFAGSRAAVDQALFRLMKAGVIVRAARGLYSTPGRTIDAAALAQVVAKKTGEQLGLGQTEFVNDQLVVPTSGTSRTLRALGHFVQFRRMSPRKVRLASTPKGRVLLALWNKGLNHLTTLEIQRATGHWETEELDRYSAMIPAWLRAAIQDANAPRKSTKIGLSGAYDWSSPNMRDDVLIGSVLEKHQFEDVVRLCLHYGLPKVRRVARRRALDTMTSATVVRMLRNISRALRPSKEASSA